MLGKETGRPNGRLPVGFGERDPVEIDGAGHLLESHPLRARDKDRLHLPAWKEYNRAARASNAVGIWHETYQVHAGEYEAIYGNMPRHGLANAGVHEPVSRKGQSAARRIGATQEDIPAVVYHGD